MDTAGQTLCVFIALQQTIIENQVNVEVLFFKCESLLACLEKESLSQFKKELLHLADNYHTVPGTV